MSLDPYLDGFPAQSPTAAQSLARVLRQAILDGALEGGTLLRQGKIAQQFGVSRIPVREALLKLEGEGLVETQPRRGVVVTSLSPEDFNEILEMRYALEGLALELAAQRFSSQDLADALALVDEAYAHIPADGQEDLKREFESRWGNLNWEFHKRLYEVAQRPRLLDTIENLHQLFARHLRRHIRHGNGLPSHRAAKPPGRLRANRREWPNVLEEHRNMALACARHDAVAAQAILKQHIFHHGGQVVENLRQDPT